ncbi:hypothetical protein HELRODRAFT_164778 [Helobdella robusta]|uniref:Mitochondrial carrier protein n=1 Tax=Helobdella robusta TaxID=6412 RepID=T1EVS9_HELRO|nr:hypothetical protein HELRODRAFT_164778 [Helobdella robusta]ESN92689.1 hypothetical protein HELRODRAFT_164778 [Helobdella robusta]
MTSQQSDMSFARRTAKNSVSGTISGIAGCIVGHPFDTLKVRLQTQPVHAPIYNGLIDCFMKTLKWEGIGGLYKGVGSPIVGQMFFRATLFTSFYQLKTKMQIQIIRAKSGGIVQYRNVFHAGYVITKTHGVKALFQGLIPTIMRDTPGCAAYFGEELWGVIGINKSLMSVGFYEVLKTVLTPSNMSVANPPTWCIFIAAATGGTLYWVITYPIDVIKSTLQSDESDKKQRKFKGVVDCARRLYLEEGGWRRFFKGFSPCLMRAIPANVTMLWTVEKCRIILDPYF